MFRTRRKDVIDRGSRDELALAMRRYLREETTAFQADEEFYQAYAIEKRQWF